MIDLEPDDWTPRDFLKLFRPRNLLLVLGCLAGLAASYGLYRAVGARETAEAHRHLERAAESALSDLQDRVEACASLVQAAVPLARRSPDAETFVEWTTEFAFRFPGLEALQWVPKVADPQGQAAGSGAIQERNRWGDLGATGQRDAYYPVRLARSDGEVWFDLGSDAALRPVLEEARDTGRATATPRADLFQNEGRRWHVLLLCPVYRADVSTATLEDRRNGLMGFVLGVLDVVALAAGEGSGTQADLLDVWIYDERARGPDQILFPGPTGGRGLAAGVASQPEPPRRPLVHEGPVHLADRTWRAAYLMGPALMSATEFRAAHAVLAAGVLLTLAVVGCAAVLIRQAERRGTAQVRLADADRCIRDLTTRDALTGTWNRQYLLGELWTELDRCRRNHVPLALALVNLDHFREVNETVGPEAADQALARVARMLGDEARSGDIVGRHGDDEFMILMPGVTLAEAATTAERIRRRFLRQDSGGKAGPPITASIGIAAAPPGHDTSPTDLIRRAGRALSEAKRGGGNNTKTAEDAAADSRGWLRESPHVAAFCDEVADMAGEARDFFVHRVEGLAGRVDARSRHGPHHTANVRRCAVAIAESLGLDDDHVAVIGRAAVLHDIGNIAVPEEILAKEGLLTGEERRLMEQHVLASAAIAESTGLLDQEIGLIRLHHERWDGSGHPDGLQGSAIPVGARVLAVADAFSAITEGRAYRPARDVSDAVQILLAESERQFDPQVVDALIMWLRTAGEQEIETVLAGSGQGQD